MNFAKAIEILDLNIKEAGKNMPADTLDALKLSRECTRYCKLIKRYPHLIDDIPLPAQDGLNLPPFDVDLYSGCESQREEN